MDPNATLARIRELAAQLEIDSSDPYVVEELAEQFTALDEWLSKGGFKPSAWVTPITVSMPPRYIINEEGNNGRN